MQNPWKFLKQEIADQLEVDILEIEEPENFGDFAYPCFSIAKKQGKNPNEIAQELAKKVRLDFLKEVKALGPYVNFFIDWKKFGVVVLKNVNETYGSKMKNNRIIIIDYSSPNIAKPMHVGHLRSTIIGQAIYNIYKFLGYKCIGWNYIGDWGTHFGKVIVAYKKWGSKKKLKKEPIKELLRLYVKFHEEAKKNPELEEEGRKWFKKLEDNDKEALVLWKNFRELSIKELEKIYKNLNIKFDCYIGESFFNKMARDVINEGASKGIVTRDPYGAIIIDLSKYNLPVFLIQKSDEATLYSTRDLAMMKYRYEKFKFYKNVYVVSSEQKLHFQQLFKACELLGYEGFKNSVHVDFGLVSLPEGKLSTREGRVIFLEELIKKSIDLAKKIVNEKNPKLSKNLKEKIATQVGIGAIKFNDLSNDRTNNIVFDWNKMLNIEGRSGPYIQYTYARACSILRKAKSKPKLKEIHAKEKIEEMLIKKIAQFPEIVEKSAKEFKPNHVANYCFELADEFNKFYQSIPVLKADKELRDERLKLVECVKTVLKMGLNLLGIEAPEKM